MYKRHHGNFFCCLVQTIDNEIDDETHKYDAVLTYFYLMESILVFLDRDQTSSLLKTNMLSLGFDNIHTQSY